MSHLAFTSPFMTAAVGSIICRGGSGGGDGGGGGGLVCAVLGGEQRQQLPAARRVAARAPSCCVCALNVYMGSKKNKKRGGGGGFSGAFAAGPKKKRQGGGSSSRGWSLPPIERSDDGNDVDDDVVGAAAAGESAAHGGNAEAKAEEGDEEESSFEVLEGFEDLLRRHKQPRSVKPPAAAQQLQQRHNDETSLSSGGQDALETAAVAEVEGGSSSGGTSSDGAVEVGDRLARLDLTQARGEEMGERGETEAAAAVPERDAPPKRSKSAAAAGRGALNASSSTASASGYVSFRLENASVTYKNDDVLKNVTWEVKSGDRVGLVGRNGSGKTTQLRILAGLQEPTAGALVQSSRRLRAAFLRQEFIEDLDASRTLREELQSAFAEQLEHLREYERVEGELAAAGDDAERLDALLRRLEAARTACERTGAFNIDARVDRIMAALGFDSPDDPDQLVASYSGGWKMRIGLGKILLQEPDLLLLDEPTNHLDLESVEWLEEYLRGQEIPMVIVAHDREFLDRLCSKMVEVEHGEAHEYAGNYTAFLRQKRERLDAWKAAYERQQKYIQEQRQFINKFRGNASRASQVKSREKLLEKMLQSGELVRRPPAHEKGLRFRFPPAPRSGRDVVTLHNVSKRYGERALFEKVDLTAERGDRIALIGPNGCGKSTLLRLICGEEAPSEGEVTHTQHGIELAYFEQNQADALDLELTVMETVSRAAPGETTYEAMRALLGKFLFKGDTVNKRVASLSGGEKARLALCKILLKPANLLVLDEPTNHLDIAAKEEVEEALLEYDGTLILVSHDRYFVSRVATQIGAIEDGSVVLYDGDYRYYMEHHDEYRQRLDERAIVGVTEIRSAPVANPGVEVLAEHKQSQRKKNFGGAGVKTHKDEGVNAKRWK